MHLPTQDQNEGERELTWTTSTTRPLATPANGSVASRFLRNVIYTSLIARSGLDKQTLSICVGMIEAGANPDTLAVGVVCCGLSGKGEMTKRQSRR